MIHSFIISLSFVALQITQINQKNIVKYRSGYPITYINIKYDISKGEKNLKIQNLK